MSTQEDRQLAIEKVAGAQKILRNIDSPSQFLEPQDAVALMYFMEDEETGLAPGEESIK